MKYCGIDVAKRKHSAMMLDENAQVVEQNFTFKNDREGFDKLLDRLAPYGPVLLLALLSLGWFTGLNLLGRIMGPFTQGLLQLLLGI